MFADTFTTAETALQIVQTEDGPITLASLDYIEGVCEEHRRGAQQRSKQIIDLQQDMNALEIRAGQLLTSRQADWAAGERAAQLDAARALEQLVQGLERSIAEVSGTPHHGLGSLLQNVKDRREIDNLKSNLQSAKTELDNRYRAVADQLNGATGVPDADALLSQGGVVRKQMQELSDQEQSVSALVLRLGAEVKRRKDVQSQVGFDALGIRADLDANGLRPTITSLALKPREIAAVSVAATLCRYKTRTQYVGGSHGLSIPLGHGFRYRVSSFRGHPIQSQFLGEVDKGTLVVTNQRVVFLGSKRDVSTPIAKVLQVEPFSNAVGIAREGKEARDIYLVSNPEYLVLYLQWVVSHQG